MRRRLPAAAAAILLCLLGAAGLPACSGEPARPDAGPAAEPSPQPSGAPSPRVSVLLEQRLGKLGKRPYRASLAGEAVRAEFTLPRFYAQRGFRAAWMGDAGALPRTRALLEAIHHSEADGLDPRAFHGSAIETLLEDLARRREMGMGDEAARETDLELLFTDAYFVLGGQLQSGKVKPKVPGYEWYLPQQDRRDLVPVLEHALETDDVAGSLKDLLPRQAGYERLRDALAEYRRLARARGWPLVTPGKGLREGDRDARVALLRRRLQATHDLSDTPAPEDRRVFDEGVTAGLKHFQLRHGIKPDGVLGGGTLAALNVSVLRRVRQLEVNLERWRWMRRELGKKYISVNIAAFELKLVENEVATLQMPVVVGNEYRHTPVFTAAMTHLILNPRWLVPRKIAVEDLLPKVQKDPEYLVKHGFTVQRRLKGKWVEVDPDDVDWSELSDEDFKYRLEQGPGPSNSLGRVKFMFPNPFNVYLHDTPAKDLFKKRIRNYSSGCIRVQKPLDLAEYLLKGVLLWSPERLKETLASGEETAVPLPEPVPVHVFYQTAWVEADGSVNFRPDLYEQDALLEQFL